jgi:hypothetical protein
VVWRRTDQGRRQDDAIAQAQGAIKLFERLGANEVSYRFSEAERSLDLRD